MTSRSEILGTALTTRGLVAKVDSSRDHHRWVYIYRCNGMYACHDGTFRTSCSLPLQSAYDAQKPHETVICVSSRRRGTDLIRCWPVPGWLT